MLASAKQRRVQLSRQFMSCRAAPRRKNVYQENGVFLSATNPGNEVTPSRDFICHFTQPFFTQRTHAVFSLLSVSVRHSAARQRELRMWSSISTLSFALDG